MRNVKNGSNGYVSWLRAEFIINKSRIKNMNTYNLMYLISKWYLIIAGINWAIALLVIFLTLQHFLEDIGSLAINNTFVKFVVAMLVSVIYGLGWIFFVPRVLYTAFFKKGK